MSRPLWWPYLNVTKSAFVQGFADAGEGVFAPDRYRIDRAQIEYEAGWGFGRWCIRRGHRIWDFNQVEDDMHHGEGAITEYLSERPVNMPQAGMKKDH